MYQVPSYTVTHFLPPRLFHLDFPPLPSTTTSTSLLYHPITAFLQHQELVVCTCRHASQESRRVLRWYVVISSAFALGTPSRHHGFLQIPIGFAQLDQTWHNTSRRSIYSHNVSQYSSRDVRSNLAIRFKCSLQVLWGSSST